MTQDDGLCDTSISLTVESPAGMGWAQLGKQCAGCVSSTQPKQTGPFRTPACGTRRQIRMVDASRTNCRAAEGLCFLPRSLVPQLQGSGGASSGSLGRRRAGERKPRNRAQPQGAVSPRPPPALGCGPWRAEARHLLHRQRTGALRSTFTSARKVDWVCQPHDHPTALHWLQE